MKIYQQGDNKSRKNNSSAVVWYVILLVATVAIITISIISAVNANKAGVDDPLSGNEVQSPVTAKPVTYVTPFEGYTVAREASLDALVYMPSINMWKTHNGVDFLPEGDLSVRVMTDGKVTDVTQTTLEGWVVTVEHEGGLVSYYKSLEQASVKVGDSVRAGDVIGKAGTMMTESDIGVHVHLEVTKDGALVDPLNYIDTNTSK